MLSRTSGNTTSQNIGGNQCMGGPPTSTFEGPSPPVPPRSPPLPILPGHLFCLTNAQNKPWHWDQVRHRLCRARLRVWVSAINRKCAPLFPYLAENSFIKPASI